MFKIGDFSKLSQVTSKALRYYDDVGLLKPAHVDRFTGYRYYTLEQLPRLNRIVALKELGFSLDQIARILEDTVSAEQIQGMLRLKQAEIEQHIVEEQQRLLRVQARLQQIQNENKQSVYDVVVKKVEAVPVATIREKIPHYGHIGRLLGALFAALDAQQISVIGAPIIVYHDGEYCEKGPDVEVAVNVDSPGAADDRLRFTTLDPVTVATTIHTGSYDTLSAGYGALLRWVEANGYTFSPPNREVYLRGPGPQRTPDDFVTEIQYPVVKNTP